MNRRVSILIFTLAMWLTNAVHTAPGSSPVVDREYKIKAAFLYNFLRTVDWPISSMPNEDEPFRIGILGKDRFGKQLDPVTTKRVKNRRITLDHYPSLAQLADTPNALADKLAAMTDTLRSCHVLFICRSEQEITGALLKAVQGHAVLTVGESSRFLEREGMINFIPTAQKGDFEINLTLCEQAELKLSSKLLRIAKRVIYDKQD